MLIYGSIGIFFAVYIGMLGGIVVYTAPISLLLCAGQNKTTEFFMTLPVKRKQIVLSQVLTVSALEGVLLAVCAVGMIPANFLYSPDNIWTFAPLNLYCIGVFAATFGLMNLVTLPFYFADINKRANINYTLIYSGMSVISTATGVALIGSVAKVGEVHILWVFDAQWRWLRGVVCAGGVSLWAALTALSYAISVRVLKRK